MALMVPIISRVTAFCTFYPSVTAFDQNTQTQAGNQVMRVTSSNVPVTLFCKIMWMISTNMIPDKP